MPTASTTEAPLVTRAKLFRGLSDTSRLAILEVLRPGPLNVGDIVEATGLGQSNVSNHLACLLDCGLVDREQRGRFVFYRLGEPRVAGLLELADELLDEVALGVDACRRYEPGGDACRRRYEPGGNDAPAPAPEPAPAPGPDS